MRGIDARVNRHDRDRLIVFEDLRREHGRRRAIGIHDAQKPIGVDLILELAQQAVEGSHEPVRPVGTQLARVEHVARGADRLGYESFLELMGAKKAVERGVTGDGRDDRFGLARQVHVGTRRLPASLGLRAGRQEDAPAAKSNRHAFSNMAASLPDNYPEKLFVEERTVAGAGTARGPVGRTRRLA